MISLLLAAPALALTLTYEEALRRAGEANVDVRDAEQDVIAAEATLLSARAAFEPTLAGEGAWFSGKEESTNPQFGEAYTESDGWTSKLSVTQPMATGTSLSAGLEASRWDYLFRGQIEGFDFEQQEEGGVQSTLSVTLAQALLQGHRLAWNLQGVRAARSARSVAEATQQVRRQQALADTARAFWQARYQRNLVLIAEQTLVVATEQRRVVEALVQGGRLAPVEATRAEAAQVQAERALLDARNAARSAEDALLVLVGEAPGAELELAAPTPDVPALSLEADRVVESVLAGNPELQAARLAVEERRLAVADARHAMLPELGVSATLAVKGYESELAASIGEAVTGEFPNATVGASLSVPLANRADRGALAHAKAQAASADLDVWRTENALAQAARAQVRTLESAARNVELARLNVRLAEETLAADQARLTEGRALQKDVSDALRGLDQARVEAERALTDYLVAVVELERLKGGL